LSDYEEIEKELNGILEKYGLSLPYSPQSKAKNGEKLGLQK